MKQTNDQVVVLVHGLGGSRLDMWPIARRLKRKGFTVRNWGYRSLGQRIQTHANRLGRELLALEDALRGSQFHLVTHSMGGVIARAMFAEFDFRNPGRVVMLAKNQLQTANAI